jgi:hypothetical protein
VGGAAAGALEHEAVDEAAGRGEENALGLHAPEALTALAPPVCATHLW